jgi:hypothetical protein
MTLPYEEVHSLKAVRRFLYDLLDPSQTPRVPKTIRLRAHRLSKHYPTDFSVQERYPDVAEVSDTRLRDAMTRVADRYGNTLQKLAQSEKEDTVTELETLRAENTRLRSALLRIEREVVDARCSCVKPQDIPLVNTDWMLGVTDEALRQRLDCELYKGEG